MLSKINDHRKDPLFLEIETELEKLVQKKEALFEKLRTMFPLESDREYMLTRSGKLSFYFKSDCDVIDEE